jgi:hypothetical protein
VPAPEQKLLATVVPSDCKQDTVRVSEAVAEHVEDGALQAVVFQEYVQVEVSLKVCESAPSVPQEKPEVGVHEVLAAGAVPEQKVLATVVPSFRVQVMARVSVPELTFALQVPVRVCGRLVPQPVVGVQAE